MTKKQFTKLSEFNETFAQAKAGYYRALLRTDVDILADIYSLLGYKIENKNCNVCILTMLKNLANEMDNYKNKHNKNNEALD